MVITMKEREKEVLKALLANAKCSDHCIARNSHLSQPTVTRIRNRLEKNGVIQSYLAMPNLEKLGFEIVALTIVDETNIVKPIEKDSRVIFIAKGIDYKTDNYLVVSIHVNFYDYVQFRRMYKAQTKFLLSTSEKPMKLLCFKNIFSCLVKTSGDSIGGAKALSPK